MAVEPDNLDGRGVLPDVVVIQRAAGQGQPLKPAMAELRRLGGGFAVVIVGYAVQNYPRGGAIAHGHAAHIAAALGCGLDLNAVQRVGKVAVPNLHVLHTAAHLAADADAVAVPDAAVKHLDVGAGTADFVSLGVFAALDGNCVVAGMELAGEQCAVCRGIRVPTVAVPDALGFKNTVVGLDIIAVDHVESPRRTVFERNTAEPDILAVAQVY